jgi:aminopeptidase N
VNFYYDNTGNRHDRMKRIVIFFLALVSASFSTSQNKPETRSFSHADSLRGFLSPARKCYDVRYYHLDVRIDPGARTISGSTLIVFDAVSTFGTMQVDLFANLAIDTIFLDDNPGPQKFTRDSNAFYISFPVPLQSGTHHAVRIAYSGHPITATNPPWDGGFSWSDDSAGNPGVAVTCQGTGASCWWPNKDHQSDEPDSMLISVTVPDTLTDISNGRLRSVMPAGAGWKRWDWFVSYPINNYDVTVNIGKFSHFSDIYLSGGKDTLTLDYYILPAQIDNARRQFRQVPVMMKAFEKYFGPYPFIRDGYKLIECSHTGMEHQSAVAYGNRYLRGYRGYASSAVGLDFDFIIIHESAHEWWGNSVTAADIADMWIHESFGAYAEALYVEATEGRDASLTYINAKRQNVRNTSPIAGVYNVQNEGSGDMYDKGQLVLNTLRSVVANDTLWFSILRGIQSTFAYRTVGYDDIVRYMETRTGLTLQPFFSQYIRNTKLPRLDLVVSQKGKITSIRYRWKADVDSFAMPVGIVTGKADHRILNCTPQWQVLKLEDVDPASVHVEEKLYYCDTNIIRVYQDPEMKDERP